MFKRLVQSRIALRLPALVVLSLVVSIAASSSIYYLLFRGEAQRRAEDYARTVAEHASDRFTGWLESMHLTAADLAEGHLAPDAMRVFNEAMALQSPGLLDELRGGYIDRNDQGGQRDALRQGITRPAYDLAHAGFHDYMREHRERFGYADLLLINNAGDIVYSIAKNDDFGTNLAEGAYADSPLARAWRNALAAVPGSNGTSDLEPYAAAGGAPSYFIARRILDHELPSRPMIGVVAIALSSEAAVSALANAGDLNPGDAVYLLDSQGRAMSPVASTGAEAVLYQQLEALPPLPQVEIAQDMESGYLPQVEGVAGNIVDAAVISFIARGAPMAAVVELDHGHAFAAVTAFGQQAALFVGLGIILSLLIGFLVARSITRPLQAFATSMGQLSDEIYHEPVKGIDRFDEIGDLARGLDAFRGKLGAARDAQAQQAEARAEQERVVEDLGRGLRDLASGHLDTRIDRVFTEGYEQLRADFNETVETMESIMRSISANATEIRARAEEVSASSDDLSHRTENQAATLEQTAAALDELTASVRAAADSASEVERVVADARREAEQSGRVVSEAVAAMSQIRKSSNEISQIIGVIDDIAFQTNLLALNAGVEAARAGDAGRGFAVVASEVRALAQRSSDAAKQIKTLITGSSQQVETGVGLVGRAGETLGMIIERVGNIDALVGEIATGAREQSSGLGEINVGVSQLDQVTQQNAAMVEEVTAAAVTLKAESRALNQVVTRFRLRDEAPRPPLSLVPSEAPDFDPEEPEDGPDLSFDDFTPMPAAANSTRWQDF